MQDENIAKLFAGQTALVAALVEVLIASELVTTSDLIRSIDDIINQAPRDDVNVTGALQHMRKILLERQVRWNTYK